MRVPGAISALIAAAIAGCGGGSADGGGSGAAAGNSPARTPKPQVRLVTPKRGAVTGPVVRVRVALKHFQISAAAVGKAPRPGQGHLHFKLDDGKFDTPRYSGKNGRLAAKLRVAGK